MDNNKYSHLSRSSLALRQRFARCFGRVNRREDDSSHFIRLQSRYFRFSAQFWRKGVLNNIIICLEVLRTHCGVFRELPTCSLRFHEVDPFLPSSYRLWMIISKERCRVDEYRFFWICYVAAVRSILAFSL